MIEIDGEFFEDPCQEAKKRKNTAIAQLVIDYAATILNLWAGNDIFVASFLTEVQADVFKVHLRTIQAQPLFPLRHNNTGGLTMSPSETIYINQEGNNGNII